MKTPTTEQRNAAFKAASKPEKRAPKRWYIKERHNPQTGVYHVCEGQLSKTAAKRMENACYGTNFMHAYDTEAAYIKAQAKIIEDGGRFV